MARVANTATIIEYERHEEFIDHMVLKTIPQKKSFMSPNIRAYMERAESKYKLYQQIKNVPDKSTVKFFRDSLKEDILKVIELSLHEDLKV